MKRKKTERKISSKNKIQSRTKITIKSLNQEKKLNILSKQIKLFQIDRREKNIASFEVEDGDLKKTKKLLLENKIEILSVEEHGIKKHLKKLILSWGLISSIVLVSIFYCLQYNLVWQIDVAGTEVLSQSEVSSFVEEQLSSRFKGKIDTKNIEIALKDKYERISAVSVAIVGQTLKINISEAYIPDEMLGNFKPICSQYDGIITKVNLVQGTLTVKVGDIVRKGDVLVEPYIIDTDGEKREVKPEASIEADVWIFGESSHSEFSRRIERTGEKKEFSEVSLFGLKIYSNVKNNTFEHFEYEEREENLTKNLILPLKVKHYTYYETTEIVENKTFSEVQEQKIEEARQNALIYLQESEIIKRETYTIQSAAGTTNVTYILTLSREIGG